MRKRLLLLVFGDIALSVIALFLGIQVRLGRMPTFEDFVGWGLTRVLIFIAVILFTSFFMEIYNSENHRGKKEQLIRILMANIISIFILSAIYYIIPSVKLWRGMLALSVSFFCALQCLWHLSYRTCIQLPTFTKRVLVLGTGRLANQIGSIISVANHSYVLSGYVNCAAEPILVPSNRIIENGSGLLETARKENAQKIVVSLTERRGTFPLKDVLNCKLGGIDIIDAPSFYEQVTGKLLIENITPSWLIFSNGFKITLIRKSYKRVVDLLLSFVGLMFALPLIPVLALFIKIDSPGPVFFKQIRVGERERSFALYKFRTMYQDAESENGAVWAQKNDPRTTRFGRILRKSRLDEIPQILNVLKGDMSFIGPRPERPEFIEKLESIIPYYSDRHVIKPGITGWAQIKYPYGASVEDAIEKLRFDLFYIKHFSLFLDILIILETIKVVLFGRGGR